MRLVTLVLFALLGVGGAGAQSAPAARDSGSAQPEAAGDEIVVRGRSLTQLRFEVQAARERAYDIFNDINSSDEYDVLCRDEPQIFTRVKRRVCRARFEDNISAEAAREYMAGLFLACQANAQGEISTQDCLFSDRSANAISRAQAVEGQAPNKRDALTAEIQRLAREHPQFAQAILDWYETNQRFEAAQTARGRR